MVAIHSVGLAVLIAQSFLKELARQERSVRQLRGIRLRLESKRHPLRMRCRNKTFAASREGRSLAERQKK